MMLETNGRKRWLTRRIRRKARKHADETGIIVYGFYFPFRLPPGVDPEEWDQVSVWVNGGPREVLNSYNRGPCWIATDPGKNIVIFLSSKLANKRRLRALTKNSQGVLNYFELDLVPGQIEYLAFQPPARPDTGVIRGEAWFRTRLDNLTDSR